MRLQVATAKEHGLDVIVNHDIDLFCRLLAIGDKATQRFEVFRKMAEECRPQYRHLPFTVGEPVLRLAEVTDAVLQCLEFKGQCPELFLDAHLAENASMP